MLLLALALILLSGCGARTPLSVEEHTEVDVGDVPGVDAPFRERPPGIEPDASFWIRTADDEIDLLFMIDNSNEMREEMANLIRTAPTFVETLASPRDEDGDGEPDYPVPRSIQVGVISSDMGTGGYPVSDCDNSELGDDGVLQNLPSPVEEDCSPRYPKFLTYESATPDADFAHDFACIANLGTGGCSFEQQLAAVDKALTVHAKPFGPNEGFLRPYSLLTIVLATDEEDCSVEDPVIFSASKDLGPLNLRCFHHPEFVRPVEEVVAGLLSVRPRRPDRIVAAGLVGVPTDLVSLTAAELTENDLQSEADFDRMLDDPRMQEAIDYSPEGGGNRLVPSCSVPGFGITFPPRRIVEYVRDLDSAGAGGIVQSICQVDQSAAFQAVAREVQNHLQWPGCTSSPLLHEDGREAARGERLACALYETRYDRSPCEGVARVDRGTVRDARVCQVCQVGDGPAHSADAFELDVSACSGSEGWSYDPTSPRCPDGGRIVFTSGSEPDPDAVVYLECRWPPV